LDQKKIGASPGNGDKILRKKKEKKLFKLFKKYIFFAFLAPSDKIRQYPVGKKPLKLFKFDVKMCHFQAKLAVSGPKFNYCIYLML
jgi:hypothetical protein